MLKVMIVDDDFIVRRGMCEAIPWAMYEAQVVEEAGDGEEALDKLPACMPDVIFCDVVMPRMNGIDLLAKVRARWPWIKMVMVSAHDEASYVRQALKGEAVDYLLKPFHEEDVGRVLKAIRERLSRERVTLSERTRENPQFLFEAKGHVQAVGKALRAHEQDRAVMEVCALFYAIRSGAMKSRLLITSLCVELLVDAMHALREVGADEAARQVAEHMSEITRHGSLDTLEEDIIALVEDIAVRINEAAGPDARLVSSACRIIEEGYAQNLTVSSLAEQLHVSGNTLQKIFKQQMDHTIRQHIITVRMERAKELLRTTREKVYAIGVAVGYQDTDFFTRTFVKATGMTPQQYREL